MAPNIRVETSTQVLEYSMNDSSTRVLSLYLGTRWVWFLLDMAAIVQSRGIFVWLSVIIITSYVTYKSFLVILATN